MFIFLSLASSAYADNGYPYSTDAFDVTAEVSEAHVIHMEETIRVNFRDLRHGIVRYIPVSGEYYIENLECRDEKYSTSKVTENGHEYSVIKIGDADRYVEGVKRYRISYDIYCIKDKDTSSDSLALDLLPTSWETEIKSAHVSLKMPADVDPSAYTFYLGAYGDSSRDDDLDRYVSTDGRNINLSLKNLAKGEGLTVRAKLPEGYWKGEADRSYLVYFILGLAGVFTLIILLLWFALGRDPETVPVVNFYPPDGMTPADVGYVADGSVDVVDISSMIMYYASKGYVTLEETANKEDVKITRVKDIDEEAESERTVYLFRQFFRNYESLNAKSGGALTSEDVKTFSDKTVSHYDKMLNGMYTTSSKVGRVIAEVLMAAEIVLIMVLGAMAGFDSVPWVGVLVAAALMFVGLTVFTSAQAGARTKTKKKITAMLVIGGLLFAAGVFIAGFTAGYGFSSRYGGAGWYLKTTVPIILLFAVQAFFTVYMKAKTQEYTDLIGQLEGFRNFIRDAEYQKLKALSDEDPSYFYDIMPYAMVFGMGTKWSKKFEDIAVTSPAWYVGTGMMDYVLYSSMFHSIRSGALSSAAGYAGAGIGGFDFGSGGGFGGGGFSGGGFGGGGGGAW
ncbi:MAG: DUF2207 domain-containing protein [Anaerovoracaceae bacterium]